MRLLIAAGADLRADAAAALNASLLSRCRACVDLVIGALDAPAISQTLGAMARFGEIEGAASCWPAAPTSTCATAPAGRR